ncbi:MAG: glycosyltransferase family 4 protein [Dehalococcoidia bacterium]|nr:glycosyltransferase family 4 protein [Dehalococcoidia bacterium]
MRIAIDATSVPPRPAGAGVYSIELVRALAETAPAADGFAVFTRGGWFDDIGRGRRNWRVERVRGSRLQRALWEQARLPSRLRALGVDVVHSTHHSLPLQPLRCRRVVTVHDLTFLRLPQRYPVVRRLYMQLATRLAARIADAIVVPSQAVRDDVRRLLGEGAGAKTHVVYEAAAARFAPAPDRRRAGAVAGRYGIAPPYVLSVGSLEPGKNRGRLIRALRALRDEGISHRLVVVGQRAWKYGDDFALVRELGMERQVRFPGYVGDDDLAALYAGAAAFALPALYEGFGLPVLEAMACGTPVLTSNTGATAEVAGDAALLVDPLSTAAIRDGLRALLTDAGLREDLRARGLRRAAEFSWQRAARETLAVYRMVAGGEASR